MTITINGTTGITQPADNLAGSSSGTVTVQPAAAAGTWTMTLPTTAGTNGYVLGTDGTGITNWVATAGSLPTPTTAGNVIFTTNGTTWSSTQKIVQGTAVATTSGTSVDFTSIPSWVKRITVTFNGLSTNGSSPIIIQLGSTTFTTSGYLGGVAGVGASTSSATNFTSGLPLASSGAAPDIRHGSTIISNLTGNIWTNFTALSLSNTNYCNFGGGSVTLSGVLDRVRITTVNGTDTFDAGNINILYE